MLYSARLPTAPRTNTNLAPNNDFNIWGTPKRVRSLSPPKYRWILDHPMNNCHTVAALMFFFLPDGSGSNKVSHTIHTIHTIHMHKYTHTQTHTHTHTHIHTYTHTHVHAYTHALVHTYMRMCAHLHIYPSTDIQGRSHPSKLAKEQVGALAWP